MESLGQCQHLEVSEKARNVLCDVPTSVWPQGVKEFNKTIIPFSLVGYETGYSHLGATRLIGYLPSHIQRALME